MHCISGILGCAPSIVRHDTLEACLTGVVIGFYCISYHTVSETDFRLKKYMTNETYIFRQVNMSVIDDIKEWKSLDYQFFDKIQIYVFRPSLSFHRLPLPRSPASILSFLFKSLYKSTQAPVVVLVNVPYVFLIQKKTEVKKMEWTASDPNFFEFLVFWQSAAYILRTFVYFFGL